MVENPVVFEQTMQAMFLHGLKGKLTSRCKERLKAAGLDVERPLLPAYPFDTWMLCLKIAAEELFPGMKADDALLRLGEMFVEGFNETFLGRAVLSVARVLGPKRTLVRSTQNFRSGNNYTETRLEEVSATCFDLWLNEVGPYPSFTAGIIAAGVRAAGAKHLVVEVLRYDGHACTYRVAWGAEEAAKHVIGSNPASAPGLPEAAATRAPGGDRDPSARGR